ncbi:MAG: HPr family phosphocarrier protein [Phycisphaerales bacterium]|nr:HPr family phosphocarrier protein [Phycisphaerales bacterium]
MDPAVAIEREVVIPNKEGLHFRPIMQFVDLAQRYQAGLSVHCDDRSADGRSPMEMLMLVAIQGSKVRVVADGADAQELVDAIVRLVESGFGET